MGAPVAHMKFATTVATTQQSHEQALPSTDRRHRFVALPVHGVPPDHTLVLFEGGPVKIPWVMIGKKDAALRRSTGRALTLLQPSFHHHGLDGAPPPHIGASVEGVAEHVADQALRRDLPDDARPTDRIDGELDVVITKPLKTLTHAPELTKLGKDEVNGIANPLVRMQHDFSQGVPRISDGQPLEQLSATRFG